MTIKTAIELLLAMQQKHGDVEILFDCQHCGKSTRPDQLVAVISVTGK